MSSECNYTQEQDQIAKKVASQTDFYKILDLEKGCQQDDIKKAYRKLALKLHPDKNKSPKASEAFKKIAKAYDTLQDTDKRRNYDQFGEQSLNQGRNQNFHNFQQDIDPNDIFNFMFNDLHRGGGFRMNGNGFHFQQYFHNITRFGGFGNDPFQGFQQQMFAQRQQQRRNHQQEQQEQQQEQQQRNYDQRQQHRRSFGIANLLSYLPMLFILYSIFGGLFKSSDPFSLHQTRSLNILRKTNNLQIPYFVDYSFHNYYDTAAKLSLIEEQIENKYANKIYQQCKLKQQQKQNLQYNSQFQFGSYYRDTIKKIEELDMSACNQFQELKNKLKYFKIED